MRQLLYCIPRQEGGFTCYYMSDTIVGYPSLPQTEQLKHIINEIGVIKPFYEEYLPDVLPRRQFSYRVYEAFVARSGSRELVFPEFSFTLTRSFRNDYYSRAIKWNYNNEFDPRVISLLEETDTLAVQEYESVYVRAGE